jgi:undecaprenyl-diphosphatase
MILSNCSDRAARVRAAGSARALLRRVSTNRSSPLPLVIAAASGMLLLAVAIEFDEPPRLDLRVRRVARSPRLRPVATLLRPLFPVGLPGGYITIAHLVERHVARRTGRAAPEIPLSAWAGWLVHRGFKVFYRRVRPPRPGAPRRTDSYPSGHTTGATALALTMAHVLARRRLLSTRAALALGVLPPVVMGAYRVLADDHWATDVMGGWLLGGAIDCAVRRSQCARYRTIAASESPRGQQARG